MRINSRSSTRSLLGRARGWLATAGIVAALVMLPAAAAAQDVVEAELVVDHRAEPPPKPAFVPASVLHGFAIHDAVPLTVAPPIDLAAVQAEDAAMAQTGDKRLRYGIGRDVWIAENMGRWDEIPGGRIWRADVTSPGADGLRLRFMDVQLPPGANLVVYPLNRPDRLAGPYTGRGMLEEWGEDDFWTPTRFDSILRIEYHEPLAPGAVRAGLPFIVDAIQHIYRDPLVVMAEQGLTTRVGTCHNNAACYAAWASVVAACGGIGYISGASSLYCSGQLLATTTADQTPYFLTAEHCVGTNSEAASSEIYWKYQTTTAGTPGGTPNCSGTVPSLASVPQSGPCTRLASGAAPGSDYSLLMVEGVVPTGISWVGWTNAAIATNTASTCVHHPDGSWKRISFGTRIAGTVCGGGNFNRISWNSAVTEPGSSGAGIFRDSDQKLYGQLYCGFSSCSQQSQDDDFGRFDVSYIGLSSLLTAGSDDALEPNDSCAAAAGNALTAPGAYSGLIVKSTDEDWYRISVGPGQTLTAAISLTSANGDIDMQLYGACGGPVLVSAATGGNSDTLTWSNSSGSTTSVFLRVYLFNDTRNTYGMTIGVAGNGIVNDACASALTIGAGATAFSTVNATTDGPDEPAACNFFSNPGIAADIWFRHIATCTGTLAIDTCGSAYDTELAVYGAACPLATGQVLACNDDNTAVCGAGSTRSALTLGVGAGQSVLIRVGGYNGATGTGVLNIACTPTATGACCGSSGACVVAPQSACGGTYIGDGLACAPNPCPQPLGACCEPSGACVPSSAAACTGAFQGVGVACAPNPCPQPIGACCRQTVCTVETQSACTGSGGAFVGAGSACGTAINPTTCCRANFNGAGGVTVQDIFDFLAAYFGGTLAGDFNGNGGLSVQDIFDFLAAYFAGC